MRTKTCLLSAVSLLFVATPAFAQSGEEVALGDAGNLVITGTARLRLETVDQDNAVGDAEAVTLRGRLGGALQFGNFEVFGEAELTTSLIDNFNDTLPGNGIEPYSVVADPDNLELNRLHVSYKVDGNGVTVGRQRIILDNARFVGNVGWRQNEQTFDAVRGQASIGPVSLDASYSNSQRTIFGVDSPNEFFDGDFVLLNAGVDTEVVDASAFAYLIDYDVRLGMSSDTYGFRAVVSVPGAPVTVTLSAATQEDAGGNPTPYSAEYYNVELGGSVAGFNLKAGYEELGSDGGVAAFQTPFATLHAFNGWADTFLVTPANGLRDYYGSASRRFTVPGLTTFTATVVYHEFESDFGGINYGSEIDASLGFRAGPLGIVAKFASYDADGFGVDTDKFWLQADYSF
ncbi:alginate export family protein [Aurantiacibacter gilvus]|uniref:Alginate export family protein n=1 Tax=Aurantiacibacter gilvus TaxID=3139141 RepID=A0ABU9IBD1_9SPHN